MVRLVRAAVVRLVRVVKLWRWKLLIPSNKVHCIYVTVKSGLIHSWYCTLFVGSYRCS